MKQEMLGKRHIIFLPVLLALVLVSTVLLGTFSATSATATETGPQTGGILKIISPMGAVNLGYPFEDRGFQDIIFLAPCLESLLTFDEECNVAPKLATDWEISPDYSSITLTLRKGVKFHDGTTFNAKAAKFNLDLHREKTLYPTWKLMSSIDVIDDYTIRINLSSWDPTFISAGPLMHFIVSPTAVKTLGKEACKTHPVGTGPFKFKSFERDVSLKFERFDDYWQKGKPYLDGLEWVVIADAMTSLLAFKGGNGQVIRELAPMDGYSLKQTEMYNFNITTMTVEGMVPDSAHADSPFADIKVRQAIAYAINREEIVEATGYGFTGVSNQILPREHRLYNTAVKGYPYNPKLARDLLSQAGYDNNLEFTITYKEAPGVDEIWTAVQGYLDNVGVKVHLDGQTMGSLIQACTSDWHNAMIWTGFPGSPDADLVQQLNNLYSKTSGWYREGNMLHPDDYSHLLAEAVAESDFVKRNAMGQELVKMIIDDYCLVIPVFPTNAITAMYPEVHDLNLHKNAYNHWSPENAWLSK